MRLIFSGDKHLGLLTEGENRLSEQLRVLKFCAERSDKVDLYIDLGDLYDRPRPAPDVIADTIHHFFEIQCQAYWLVGNHDRRSRGEQHALEPLEAAGAVVVAEPTVVDIDPGKLVLLPFVTEWMSKQRGHASAQAWLDAFAADAVALGEPLYVAGHIDVDGSEHSDERDIGLRVPTILLENAEHVWLGHIHRYQEVRPNVTIVGSAIQCNFGECEDQKGIVEVQL